MRCLLVLVLCCTGPMLEARDRRRAVAAPGTVSFVVNTPGSVFGGLAELPDGSIAFTGTRAGVVSQEGELRYLSGSTYSRGPLAVGADGTYWTFHDTIRRITPDGQVIDYRVRAGAGLRTIIPTADGGAVFQERWKDRVGWITPAGDVKERVVPFDLDGPAALVPDGGGAFWVIGRRTIGKLIGDRVETSFVPDPVMFVERRGDTGFVSAARGRDGSLWLVISSEYRPNIGDRIPASIIRMTTDGRFDEMRLPDGVSDERIVLLPDDSAVLFTPGTPVVYHRAHDGKVRTFPMPPAWYGRMTVIDVIVARNGTVWLALGDLAGGLLATLDVN